MAAASLDVERKYAAGDAFELPRLVELLRGAADGGGAADAATPLAEGPAVGRRSSATYFDTSDGRLSAAGLTVRRSTGGDDAGWHLEVPVGGDGRSELRLPLGRGSRTVPARLRAMLRAHTGGAPLRPVAEIVTERTARRLVDATGQVVAEVGDDRVTARRLQPPSGADARDGTTSWREIDVELANGAGRLLDSIDARLRKQGLVQVAPTSDLAHLLGADAAGAASGEDRPQLTGKSPAGEVVLAHVREQVHQLRAHDVPVRLGAPDSVHKMRVATRRLRSALTTFKPLFDPAVVRPLRDELKWLAGELGAARDAEVMRDRVATAVDGATADGASGQATADLDENRRRAHDQVLADLDGERYHQLLASLDGLVTSPPVTATASRRAARVLPRRVRHSVRTVRRLVERAEAEPDAAAREELLHDSRKSAKAARYVAESVAPVFGKKATALAEAMEGVQEALGEHQDSVLTRARLRELATSTSSTEAAFLYGRLYALEEARAGEYQQHFARAWKAAQRKSLLRWTH